MLISLPEKRGGNWGKPLVPLLRVKPANEAAHKLASRVDGPKTGQDLLFTTKMVQPQTATKVRVPELRKRRFSPHSKSQKPPPAQPPGTEPSFTRAFQRPPRVRPYILPLNHHPRKQTGLKTGPNKKRRMCQPTQRRRSRDPSNFSALGALKAKRKAGGPAGVQLPVKFG